jgi:CBS domain-containing protein
MDWKQIRHLPVEDEQGRLVGLITCFEVLRGLTRAMSEGSTAPLAVSSMMVRDPLTVVPGTLTLDAIALMRREKVDCLPVINQGRLVGIVTERDFINVAARLLEQEPRHLKASAVSS